MRIAFVALSALGHLNPMTALARQLQSRNHEVVVISLPNAEPYVRGAGLAFLPYCETAFYAAGSGKEIRRQLSVRQGIDGVKLIIEAQGLMMEAALSSLPAALATTQADAVVLETHQYYVELIRLVSACRMYMFPTRFTSTTPAIRRCRCTTGRTRQPLQRWQGTSKE